MNAVRAWEVLPPAAAVRATMRWAPARWLLPIWILLPVITHSLPVRSAVVSMPPMCPPASGSVTAIDGSREPSATRGSQRPFCS